MTGRGIYFMEFAPNVMYDPSGLREAEQKMLQFINSRGIKAKDIVLLATYDHCYTYFLFFFAEIQLFNPIKQVHGPMKKILKVQHLNTRGIAENKDGSQKVKAAQGVVKFINENRIEQGDILSLFSTSSGLNYTLLFFGDEEPASPDCQMSHM